MTHLSKTAPKQFWRHINSYRKGKKAATQDVTLEDFAEHFKNLSNNRNAQQSFESGEFENQNIEIEELDRPISLSEIRYAINTLKRGKSPGFDGLISDFFIDAKDFIAPFLLKMYNVIFESAIYPESCAKGLIVPIHKKGDKGDPNNYRGITLISTFAKIFLLVLRNRLNLWCEENTIFNDFQFGLRNQRSTSDCIFILHSLIQKVLKQNSKMYCAFVDYEKAFDTVVRDALWFKLIDSGVSSKIVKMIKSLYSKVLAAVKLQTDVSNFFEISLGVKQGEPILFILFVNDVHSEFLQPLDGGNEEVNGITIQQMCLILLLFADDMVLFSTDPAELQPLLNKLYKYSS